MLSELKFDRGQTPQPFSFICCLFLSRPVDCKITRADIIIVDEPGAGRAKVKDKSSVIQIGSSGFRPSPVIVSRRLSPARSLLFLTRFL
jgi:hypothetical protein